MKKPLLRPCASCGKTYTFSCEITGVKTNAEKLYADDEDEEGATNA